MRPHLHWWCLLRVPRWRPTIVWSSAETGDIVKDCCTTCGVER